MTGQYMAERTLPRILGLLLAASVSLGAFNHLAGAAYSRQKAASCTDRTAILIISPEGGASCLMGQKASCIDVRNTGRYPVTIYDRDEAGQPFRKGTVSPGQTMTFTFH